MTTAQRLIVVDVDDDDAAIFADRFAPPNAQTLPWGAPEARHDSLTDVDRNILEKIMMFDHAWFARFPGRWEYIREPLPGEFDVPVEPLPLGKRWMVKVTAFRDFDKRVMLRIREAVLLNTTR